ncbi:MAG: DUF348 domain-containing protein [Firmicutes bacterium]|nr:DUF348 domain-containing protein [Bacillota bacterium]
MDEKPAHLGRGGKFFGRGPRVRLAGLLLLVAFFSLLAVGYGWAFKEVTLSVDGRVQVVQTLKGDVKGLLEEKGVKVYAHDLVEPHLDTSLKSGMEVEVRRAMPVTIRVDGETRNLVSAQKTVLKAVEEAGIILGSLDRLLPLGPTPLTAGIEIDVIRVEEEIITTEVAVPFQTRRTSDDSLPSGQSKVVRAGREGLARRVVWCLYENGEKVAEEVLTEDIIVEPTPRVLALGTISTSRGGKDLRLKKMMKMEATAYAPDSRSLGVNSKYTATGVRARRGIIAVDPRVIPLGTKLYVSGYGQGLAADTGGAIKGNMVDLCFDTYEEAVRFGRRQVEVYILD